MFPSNLKPDSATIVGVLTAAGIYLIYNDELPSNADISASMPHDEIIEKSRKKAAWKSAALVAVTFFVARDLNSYLISGVALVGADFAAKHANATHPQTGKLDTTAGAQSIAPGLSTGDDDQPLASYDDSTGY